MVNWAEAILLSCVLAVLILSPIAYWVHKNRSEPSFPEYRNYLLSLILWSLAESFLLVGAPPGFYFLGAAREIGGVLAALTFVYFLAVYTQSSLLLDKRFLGSFTAIGVVGVFFTSFNAIFGVFPSHVVNTYSGYFVLHRPFEGLWALYTLSILFYLSVTYAVLIKFMFQTTNIYRKQTGIIFIGIMGLTVGTFIHVFGFGPDAHLNFGLLFHAPLGVLIAVSIYYYDFLKVVPFAQSKIINTIDDPIFIVDEERRISYMNEACDNLGMCTQTSLGKDIQEAVPGIFEALDEDSDGTFKIDYGSSSVVDCSEDVYSGKARWYNVSQTVIEGKHGDERGCAIVCSDITDQKEREQYLDQFASMVSHDLRSPLNVASGHVDLARMTGDEEHFDKIEENHDRIEELIDELLLLAKQGFGDIDVESVNIESISWSAWDHISSNGHELEVSEFDQYVLCDSHLVQQMLENLFRNAIEHNEGDVSICVGPLQDGFYVSDDGSGIPSEKKSDVFDAGVTTNEDGTGFGLHIVRQFSVAHDWEILVTDSESGGARFEFRDVSFQVGVQSEQVGDA